MQGSSDQIPELLDAGGLVGHPVPAGSVYALVAEHRRRLFPDVMFEDLFPSRRGRPSVPGDVVATVMVLQSWEGLSDRDAVEAFRTDLRWKVACGRSLVDEGFHPTVLTLWRNRLRVSDVPERVFDAVRQVVEALAPLVEEPLQKGVLSEWFHQFDLDAGRESVLDGSDPEPIVVAARDELSSQTVPEQPHGGTDRTHRAGDVIEPADLLRHQNPYGWYVP